MCLEAFCLENNVHGIATIVDFTYNGELQLDFDKFSKNSGKTYTLTAAIGDGRIHPVGFAHHANEILEHEEEGELLKISLNLS